MKDRDEQIDYPKMEPEIDYAYILKSVDKSIKCNQEELLRIIEENEDVKFVTTLQKEGFIIPGADFETSQHVLRKKKALIKTSLN